MPRLSTSSWSLDAVLGSPRFAWDTHGNWVNANADRTAKLPLLELPAALAQRGIHTMEICHFHLASLDGGYLKDLRAALAAAKVELFGLLIDTGDITHPDEDQRARDLATIRIFTRIAGQLDAGHVRIIAGDADPVTDPGAIDLSAATLWALAREAADIGVKVNTENFHLLTLEPNHLLAILERCEGTVGLCADFGNLLPARRHDDLRQLAPHAISCHVKAQQLADGSLDAADLHTCLDIMKQNNFTGPYGLIFSSEKHGFDGMNEILSITRAYV